MNPLELIQSYWPDADASHITYDPNMVVGEFNIIRGSTHDGTMLFTIEILQRTLLPVVNGTCCNKSNQPPTGVRLFYTIGPILLEIEYSGIVDLPVGRRPGQIEQATMPVNVRW